MLRGAGAIALGFVVIGLLSMLGDTAVRTAMPGAFDATGGTTNTGVLLLIQAYVAVFAIFGCWLAARLAPSRPMLHALILGGLGLAFSIAASIALWNTAPAWYHITSLLLVMPYAWIGGRIREAQLERAGGGAEPVRAGAGSRT